MQDDIDLVIEVVPAGRRILCRQIAEICAVESSRSFSIREWGRHCPSVVSPGVGGSKEGRSQLMPGT